MRETTASLPATVGERADSGRCGDFPRLFGVRVKVDGHDGVMVRGNAYRPLRGYNGYGPKFQRRAQ